MEIHTAVLLPAGYRPAAIAGHAAGPFRFPVYFSFLRSYLSGPFLQWATHTTARTTSMLKSQKLGAGGKYPPPLVHHFPPPSSSGSSPFLLTKAVGQSAAPPSPPAKPIHRAFNHQTGPCLYMCSVLSPPPPPSLASPSSSSRLSRLRAPPRLVPLPRPPGPPRRRP